jgi:aspartyl-tRNA(Asn)/glutamyl-tRNA(Gln) amidotransferase subunit A
MAPPAPLEGVPLAHKDIFVTRDFPTTAGSRCCRATARRLTPPWCQAGRAGVVTLGKLNCDEFAMGSAQRKLGHRRRGP